MSFLEKAKKKAEEEAKKAAEAARKAGEKGVRARQRNGMYYIFHFFLQINRIFLPSSLKLASRISKYSERADFIFAAGYIVSLNLYL